MAEGRARDEWQRASAMMALLANCHRDPRKRRPYRPNDFDPFQRTQQPIKVGVHVLRDVFLNGRMPAAVADVARRQGGEECGSVFHPSDG